MKAVVLVARRAGVPERDRAWEYVYPWWKQFGFHVEVVEHPGPEPFNRSWCMNEAARRAWPWDVALFVDADVIEGDPQQVHQAVEKAWETGNFTVAHTSGRDFTPQGTELLLSGADFNWQDECAEYRPRCDSRVNAIRADLFAEVGGFDERFRGWGHEDYSFALACQTLRGKDFVPGTSWHLWHPKMLRVARHTLEWKAGYGLAQRYLGASGDVGLMRAVLDGRRTLQQWTAPTTAEVDLYIPTCCGRSEELEGTIRSFTEHVHGRIRSLNIVDDSGDADYGKWLDHRFGDRAEIIHHEANLGYGDMMRRTWSRIGHTEGAPYVFWSEDDFAFERDVELDDLAAILEHDHQLAQVVLLREAFYPRELQAGSIPKEHPESYTRREAGGRPYLEHTRFFSCNPSLMRREVFSAAPWPETGGGSDSEALMGPRLTALGYRFAFAGEGEPWIRHTGRERVVR